MRLLIDRIEVRVVRAQERARGERMADLVRHRLGNALGRRADAAPRGAPTAPPAAGAGPSGGRGATR